MRGKPLTDEEIAQIALDRFRPLKDGMRETSIEALKEKWGRPKNTITSALRRAFKGRLVEMTRTEKTTRTPTNLDRAPDLEIELKRRYPSLFGAIVVRTKETSSDRIHRDLGYAMACELGNIIPHNATIGLGSGRGPYYTVTALNQMPRLSRDGITLMSLTGAVYPETHDERLNVLLDADFHTGLLGVSFSKPLTQRMISYPIAPNGIEKTRRDTWLEEKEFHEHVPTVAIVGVGVLRGRHRFYEAVKKNNPGPALAPIFADLKKLVDLADKHSNDIYCPVADVCNRLYYIDPSRGMLPDSTKRNILTLISHINEQLLTINEEQLRMIGGLLLVAGTRDKAMAIRSLLEDSESPRVRLQVVCIDAPTAELILNLIG